VSDLKLVTAIGTCIVPTRGSGFVAPYITFVRKFSDALDQLTITTNT
jgi:hypothetical protein